MIFRLGAKTDRNRESTKGAIKFAVESKKQALNTLFSTLDKKQTGQIDRRNFNKVLTMMGVYLKSNEADKYATYEGDKIDYNSFLQAYAA